MDTYAAVADEFFLNSITVIINTEIPMPSASNNCNQTTETSTLDSTNFTIPSSYLTTWIYTENYGDTNFQGQEVTVLNNLLSNVNNYISPNNDRVNDYLVLRNVERTCA